MLIENPESLKTWLTSYLEPLCDADPQALAQYVMALIGKDKPAKDLKNNLFEQLEVFLQKETEPFVEVLFQTLENKSYLNSVHSDSHSSTSSDRSPSGCDGIGNLPSTIDHYKVHEPIGSPLPSLSPIYDPKISLLNLPDSSASAPSNQLTATAHSKRSYHNRERSKSRSHSRSRSRSRSPPISSSQNRHRPRDVDMRRPGGYAVVPNQGGSRSHYIEERNRRTGWNGPSSRGMSRRYGPSSSSSSLSSSSHLGGGYRRNQQQVTRRSRSRSKSRTPSRSRSSSYSPHSNRSRSRSPSHDRGRTKDKTRNKNQNRVQSTSRSRSRNRDGPVAKRTKISSKSPLDEEGEDGKEDKPFIKKRCRDYDERGFCMRGDLCQYDHGSDPVVLDGAVSSVVLGLAANGATTLTATQSIAAGSANFLNEPYNPEAPGIDKQMNPHGARRGSGVGALVAPLRVPVKSVGNNYNHLPQHPFWSNITTPLRPIPPGPGSSSFIPSLSQQNRPRELVGVPTLSDGKNSSSSSSNINPEIPKIPHSSTIDSSTSTTISGNNNGSNSHTTNSNMSRRGGNNSGRGGNGSGHRGGFRGGYLKRMVTNDSADKCTLEVRKIPPNLNTIANLNSHFSKFGSIVNLQVCYDGDPEAALVQFASHSEALSAHRCTEAVLNNRFIKVFWHSKDQSQQSNQQSQPPATPAQCHQLYGKAYESSLRDRAANGSLVNESKNIDSNNSRPNVKERLGLRHGTDQDKNSVSTNVTSTGSISRTVFNPLLLKKQYPSSASIATSTTVNQVNPVVNPGAPNSGPVAPAKSKEDLKKDKLLKKLDLQKKRQQILLSCMQQQKLLIDKLQKAKTDKEKTDIRSTVAALDKQIKKLESDIKKDAEVILAETAKLPSSGKKSKIQVEKELLDVEMDFYNELHKGATTTELNAKLQELKIKTKNLCMNDVRYTKTMMKRFAEMKGALRGRNRLANHTLAKNFENLRKVDRRTRKIFIEGVAEDDNNVLLAHLSQTAEIESLESMPQGVMVTFKTRRDAEMALPLISTVKLKDQVPLKASWFDEAKVKTEESEIANSIDKPSDLESLIENEINLNNDKLDEDVDQEDLNEGEGVEDEEIPEACENLLKEEEQEEEQDEERKVDFVEDEEEARAEAPEDQDEEFETSPEGVNVKIDEGDNDEEGDEIGTQDGNQASPVDELSLGVGVEDDLLEEEETDDEDESRAWRR